MSLDDGDRRLLALVDAVTGRAAELAGDQLTCHAGCTPCCFGPFAVTQLDAWRLRRGLEELSRTDPRAAAGIRRRARAAVSEQAGHFPGEAGVFHDEAEEERFYEAHAEAPCPALDPDSGACQLYPWRPIACRTYGPPIRISGDVLPHCPLCFRGAPPGTVDAARVALDVDEVETPLTEQAERLRGRTGMTTIAFALGVPPRPRHGD